MKRRALFVGIALAILAFALWLLVFHRGSGGVLYQGKTVTAWSLQAAHSPNSSERDQAVAALRNAGTNALPELIELLDSQTTVAHRQLWNLGSKLPRPLRLGLLGSLNVPTLESAHVAAARSIGLFGPEAHPAIPALTRALHGNEIQVVWEAAGTLSRIGTNALPILTESLVHKSPTVRTAAARALRGMGPTAAPAIPGLVQNLHELHPEVRSAARDALTAIGRPAVTALLQVVEREPNPARLAAIEALGKMLPPPPRPVVAPALSKLLEDTDPAIRQAVHAALDRIQPARR